MVDTMARPPDSWAQDPYTPRYAPYYSQEQRGPALRLPPPSSLVTGSPTTPGTPSGRQPAAFRTSPYEGPYAASSPVHQNAQSPMLGPEPHPTASSPYARRPAEPISRLHPALSPRSPSAGDRPGELPEHALFRRLGNEPSPLQAPRLPLQPRQIGGSPQQHHRYAEIQSVRHHPSAVAPPAPAPPPPPDYQHREPRLLRSPQAPNPPRQVWTPQTESRAPERMKISEILSDEPKTGDSGSSKAPVRRRAAAAAALTYRLQVRQQPVAARSCGFGERDRRVIDPPPIVQVFIEDPKATQEEIRSQPKFRFSVMHCTIWNETGDQDCSGMPDDYRQQRRLMGTIVSSPFVGLDENNEEGCFFCFPDLSCRTPGTFRLRFSLVVLDPHSVPGSRTPVCAVAMSDVFTVYNAKDFPGMRASTALTKRLKEQGCLISIKKGNERSHARDDSEEEEDDDDDNGGGGGSGSAQRRAKRARKT
ncbi:velvet factor-domain-containing protein [Durotheca rogersii]|uniref:velvet factor-domain-containing protein n=1 Tax=Durotheca rogersii TaxID=419775 RepID=UPI00221FA850|nr:velvet factor-domain-containing protein [Durotheca rogersii]KAI5868148.1 velvet factor-domain-containing protein [Durotheca rogersii]